jgi:hypothetical protein
LTTLQQEYIVRVFGGIRLNLEINQLNIIILIDFSKFHMYADELQINHSRPKYLLSECIQEVNSDLRKIFKQSRANLVESCQIHVATDLQRTFIGSTSSTFY